MTFKAETTPTINLIQNNKQEYNIIPFIVSLLICLIISFLPNTFYFTYPFTLFTTLIHESGHAIAALLTGGKVVSMAISTDGSGLATTMLPNRFSQITVSLAGYLSSTIYGSILLIWANKTNKNAIALQMSAIVIVLSMCFFTIFSSDWFSINSSVSFGMKFFTIISSVVIATILWFSGKIKSEFILKLIVNFLALRCIINAMGDIKTVFNLSLNSGVHSDAVNLSMYTGIPAVLWAILWGITSAYIVYLSLKISFKKQQSHFT